MVEQNRDSQMLSLLKMECTPAQFAKLRSIPHYAGLPIDGRSVTTELLSKNREAGPRTGIRDREPDSDRTCAD